VQRIHLGAVNIGGCATLIRPTPSGYILAASIDACSKSQSTDVVQTKNLLHAFSTSKHGEMRAFHGLAGVVIVQATEYRLRNFLLVRG